MNRLIRAAEQACTPEEKKFPSFKTGDTINVHVKIREKGKERIQQFQGTVIQITGKKSHIRNITVRKISDGIGVERIFPLPHPSIEKIEVKQHGIVRRSRLFYLRDRQGKAAKIKHKIK